jgi:hypothetical protein
MHALGATHRALFQSECRVSKLCVRTANDWFKIGYGVEGPEMIPAC